MKRFKKPMISLLFISLMILFSAWGWQGHWKISHHAPASFPQSMSFLVPSWTTLLADHASDADDRKATDPTESPRHYINMDSYPEFNSTGRIPQTYDSVVALHGYSFVLDAGTLPWAIMNTFSSLKDAFAQKDWNKCVLYASDIGHYVADAHMPLHLTKNFDGQYTGQDGIHSRYESKMISRFYDQIEYPDDPAVYVDDLNAFVFSFVYHDFKYKDSVLLADTYARMVSGGSTSSTAYYNALWERTGPFTTGLFKHASWSIACLIYTAWVQAGSPIIYPTGINEIPSSILITGKNYPNPFSGETWIPVEVTAKDADLKISIFNENGARKASLADGVFTNGKHLFSWNGAGYPGGIYYLVVRTGDYSAVTRMIHLAD
jgi:hypothetical protein